VDAVRPVATLADFKFMAWLRKHEHIRVAQVDKKNPLHSTFVV